MADGKDTGGFELPEDFDFDATVQLNIGKSGNIVSTAASKEITPDDFEKTIDGILGINEALESMPKKTEEMETVSLSTDEIDFNEIDAGISSLADEVEREAGAPKVEQNEFLTTHREKSFQGMPLLDDNGDIVGEPSGNQSDHEDEAPVIELTEDMLEEPEPFGFPETVTMAGSDTVAETVVETPELTATERHVLSGATKAIREISDEEGFDDTLTPPVPPASQPPAKSGGSGIFLSLLAIIAIAVGGFGAWMAFDASNRIDDLKRQIQSMSPSAMAKRTQEIADIQQRLNKIERRLTGTPTIEAAAPLMSSTGEAASDENKAPSLPGTGKQIVEPVALQSEAAAEQPAAQKKAGDWVINLSSHSTEALALKEQARLQKLGLDADISSATVKNKTWYRIRINGFATKDEAKAQLKSVQDISGIKDAWIGKK